jgi:adenosylcobinamide-phosphate synthase
MTPESIVVPWLPILLAFILDLFLGDPSVLPHPVRWMGRAIAIGESICRRRSRHPVHGGMMLAGILVVGTWSLTFGLVTVARALAPWIGFLLETLLIYFCLASRSLQQAALAVAGHLRRGDLPAARRSVGHIVGRDTASLDKEGVSRAAVETVAENLVDGVLAPLFYAVIGGAPLAMAYKMVNTLDSMIGYKNERYRHFGRAAARLDDAANWLPARLSVPLVALAARFLNGRWQEVFFIALRDGRNHTSPNAGMPEAAFAGALGVRLGGPNRYQGRMVNKPWIGAEGSPVRATHIARACDLMILSGLCALAAFWALPLLLIGLFRM